jgi:hypothetical protein
LKISAFNLPFVAFKDYNILEINTMITTRKRKCMTRHHIKINKKLNVLEHVNYSIKYFIMIILLFFLPLLSNCTINFVSIGPGIFHSDKYNLEIKLPSGWAAVEGPETLFRSGSLEGMVSFNSWAQNNFWARGSNNNSESSVYNGSIIASQIPQGEAYVALVAENGPPYIGKPLPEYKFNDLSGLYKPHDWRQDNTFSAYIKTFSRGGAILELEVYCHPNASDETLTALNNLLQSWRFLK